MKKFEPQYRLVRVGLATKAERASRQQRALQSFSEVYRGLVRLTDNYRQAAQEPTKDPPWYGKGQGCQGQEGEINDSMTWVGLVYILGLVGEQLWLRACGGASIYGPSSSASASA